MSKPRATVSGRRLWRCTPRLIFRHNSLPLELVCFVTHRCVARCDHCFDGQRRISVNRSSELSIDEYEKLSASLDQLALLFLTGGEPFIREDVAEIAKLFHQNNRVLKLQVPSNGWFTERTIAQFEDLARSCPSMHSSVSISIDGIAEEHDRIRNRQGLFERACATIRELQGLARHYANIGVNVNLTLSKLNEDTALETFRYIHEKLGVLNIFLLYTRGAPRNPAVGNPSVEAYRRLRQEVQNYAFSNPQFGYRGFGFADIITHKDLLKYRTVERVMRTGTIGVPCAAGSLYGVVYANGDVSFCEMRDFGLGNLRDHGFDFRRIWLSEVARKQKRLILTTHCSCSHECAIACSLLTYPRSLGAILLSKVRRDFGWQAPNEAL